MATLLCAPAGAAAPSDPYAPARRELVRLIEQDVRDTRPYLGKAAIEAPVLDALAAVPRHEFVPASERRHAYLNRPLPIGYGQTISQPYIVAVMTDLLHSAAHHRILEIGTGSGYQAAILAHLGAEVYTMEIIAPLAERAADTLRRTGYANVEVRTGDGYYGWEAHAPFDAIIVTAAAGDIPPALIRQLKNGGRMVIPVGSRFLTQQLVVVEKDAQGGITTRQVLPVQFVPLTGGH